MINTLLQPWVIVILALMAVALISLAVKFLAWGTNSDDPETRQSYRDETDAISELDVANLDLPYQEED